MVKKLRKTKIKKKGKNKENDSKIKAIEILKKNLLEKDKHPKSQEKKILTSKKKQKIKEKRKKIKLHKIPNKKKKQKKLKEEEEEEKEIDDTKEVNASDMSLKKNPSKKKLTSSLNEKNKNKRQDSQQTLLQMIKNRKNLEDVKLNDGVHINVIKPKNSNKKKDKQKKENIDIKKEENQAAINNKKNEERDKNEFIKQIKSKIVIKNGRMIMEKPDVGLISKKYNEEHNKHISETIFVDDEKITSLSFLKKEKTKKWSEEETNNFYKALELFGLDFSFLSIVLSPRRREEIKRKYLKERRKNPGEIERAIYSRKNVSKLDKVLNLYKNEKNQNNLSITKSDSFNKRKVPEVKEEINYNTEYKNILNK